MEFIIDAECLVNSRAAEEIVSGVLVVFEFFHLMWALLMEVVNVLKHLFIANNSVTRAT
jgi:hypothetical protein